MIKRHSVESVIQAAAIEEVVGDYVSLKKRGANLLGRCPFHDEKTPSFTVSPSKGIYKCFGCGKAGNSVNFLMDHDNLSFSDAIRQLATKFGITIEEDINFNKEEFDEQQRLRENLLLALSFSNKFFISQLDTEEGKISALSYFLERGFTKQTISDFELGYSPQSWDALVNHAVKNKHQLDHFVKAGLIKKNEEKNTYFDLFRHRVIFPIHDLTGKVIAFGGRQLVKDDKSPKYLNSPETDVYHKSHVLYGIFQAKKTIKNEDNCYLVEGYTDVISLHQAEIKNVVASSGTSLTEGQIRLIKRFTDNVTVLYDGDLAGIKASLRGIDLLLQMGLNVKCVSFPEGEDPDSYCKKLGAQDFKKFLNENTKDFIFFKTDLLFVDVENDPIKKSNAIKQLLSSIALIPDNLIRNQYIHEVSKMTEVDEKLLSLEVVKIRKKQDEILPKDLDTQIQDIIKTDMPSVEKYIVGEEQEKALIRIIMQSGFKLFKEESTVIDFIFKELEEDEALVIENQFFKSIIDELKTEMIENLSLNENFFQHHQNSEIRQLSADFLMEKYQLSSFWKENEIIIQEEKDNYIRDLQSVFLILKLKKTEVLLKKCLEEINHATSDEDKEQSLKYYMNLNEFKIELSKILGLVVVF